MTELQLMARYGHDFFTPPQGKDEYYLRNMQTGTHQWRHLRKEEIGKLEHNDCSAGNWNEVFVSGQFDPDLVKDSEFYGLVRIGNLKKELLQFHDFAIPEGIYHSRIISCDIGDHCSLTDCLYLSHYLIKDRVILHDISEMQTTNHAKFGVGIIKEGEDESVRVTLNVMNEAEGRAILPFTSLLPADAWLWAKYRDDQKLMDSFRTLTNNSMDNHRGYYGTVGNDCVIKGTKIIKDVDIGPSTYIKGANKLKNLTIHSSDDEPTQLGEGIEMVNGIIGNGCHIFYGCKAVRFVLGEHCNLKYGARLLNSVLGDNSTISCCEVLSNLIFPAHEQHHNNSFLIASCIKGQSNMAAGANIGSNHNSRGADGELVAGRGFWPALSSTLKHDSSFASFTLITKGNYPHELNLPLPFSLLSSDTKRDERTVMPAYWWRHNLYALERNSWKFKKRDMRKHPKQYYETDYLAPDSAAEMMRGRELLEDWTGKSWMRFYHTPVTDYREKGRELLRNHLVTFPVYGEEIECSSTPVEILKPAEGYEAYEEMLYYYGAKSVFAYLSATDIPLSVFDQDTRDDDIDQWENLGGQLVPKAKVEDLKESLRNGWTKSWDEVHQYYGKWLGEYPKDMARNGITILRLLLGKAHLDSKDWEIIKEKVRATRSDIEEQVYLTKEKDYENPFRQITYANPKERDAVLGSVDDNPFILESKRMTEEIERQMQSCRFS